MIKRRVFMEKDKPYMKSKVKSTIFSQRTSDIGSQVVDNDEYTSIPHTELMIYKMSPSHVCKTSYTAYAALYN